LQVLPNPLFISTLHSSRYWKLLSIIRNGLSGNPCAYSMAKVELRDPIMYASETTLTSVLLFTLYNNDSRSGTRVTLPTISSYRTLLHIIHNIYLYSNFRS
jgi:hypothetical protein